MNKLLIFQVISQYPFVCTSLSRAHTPTSLQMCTNQTSAIFQRWITWSPLYHFSFGYLNLVHFSLFEKSSWPMHVDFDLMRTFYIYNACIYIYSISTVQPSLNDLAVDGSLNTTNQSTVQ